MVATSMLMTVTKKVNDKGGGENCSNFDVDDVDGGKRVEG
jgi:hypothetical protein